MDFVTIQVRKHRYDTLVDAIAALLAEYGVTRSPSDEFDIETLATVTDFERFDVLRDFAVRLGDADSVEREDDTDAVEIEVHPHHLVALTAGFPDLAGATNAPESELRVVVEGLCQSYLAARAALSSHGE